MLFTHDEMTSESYVGGCSRKRLHAYNGEEQIVAYGGSPTA